MGFRLSRFNTAYDFILPEQSSISVTQKNKYKDFIKCLNQYVIHKSDLKNYLLLGKIGEGGQASVLKVQKKLQNIGEAQK